MKKYIFLAIMLMIPVCFLVAESFVIEKPKRSTSPKKLQDQCYTACADCAENLCALCGVTNNTLQELLLTVRQGIEGDKNARFERATKEQLAHVQAQVKGLTQEIESLQKRARDISAYLKQL